jgi:nickel-dependent lactate racemase
MPAQRLSVPYRPSAIEFELPASMQATIAVTQPIPPLPDSPGAIQAALRQPVASPPLHEQAHPGDCACVVFTDITRSSPDHLLVPALPGELQQANAHDSDVILLCGTGMHRASTQTEKTAKLGDAIAERCRILDNQAQDPRMPAAACKMIPVETSEQALAMAQADLVNLREVLVVPHAMATLPIVMAWA